jgi:hypothetical protein
LAGLRARRASARAAQVPEGVVRDRWAIDRGQLPGAQQAGPVDGVAAVGVDPSPGLLREQGGGHDPAAIPVLRQIALAPRAAGAGFRDQDEGRALRVPLPHAPVEVPLAGTAAPERHHLGPVVVRDRGDSPRRLMTIHADSKRARRMPG